MTQTVSAVPAGLSSIDADHRLSEFGANVVPEEIVHPLLRVARHFWAPVPWMLEATVVLQLAVGERIEAVMVATLLLFNVALGVFQESRANAALDLLKQQLAPKARVRRDGKWADAPAAVLVPGDIVQLSLGNIVPADLTIISGALLLDQSMLTGESVPVEAGPGTAAYAGGLVRRGEAIAAVTATGPRTYFGHTAELVQTAQVESSEQRAVLNVVRALTVVNFTIVIGMVAYAHGIGMDVPRIIPLVLTALLSAVPVALPATFTLASALGARTLALRGVLLTRLPALHEAAMIDVLCADKTGTLTENALTVAAVHPLQAGCDEADVLAFAAAASSAEGQDAIDMAIRSVAARRSPSVTRFIPFDPATKMAQAVLASGDGEQWAAKGAPAAIAVVAPMTQAASDVLQRFTAAGYRTIAVAAGQHDRMELIGLIGFSDPPRADSSAMLAELRSLGVRSVMVTGDSPATAATIAHDIGLEGAICPQGQIPDSVGPEDYAVYAGVFPEDKFRLVRAYQRRGHVVGMCGDGANDAPALRQAQMGIAVSTATDVAKAAAGIVLTEPGLGGIVACIKEGRSGFQRILTYTLSILINKCATLIVLGAGLVMTGHAVLTPLLQALAMLTGDLVTMSRAADRASPSAYPNIWRVRNLTIAAVPLGMFKLSYCLSVLAGGWFILRLSTGELRTLTFLMLVLAGQANVYVLRERGHFWQSHPALVMLLASMADVAIVSYLATRGILMTALPLTILSGLFVTTLGYALGLDLVKIAVLARVRID